LPQRQSSDDEVEPFQGSFGLSEEYKTAGVKPEKKAQFRLIFLCVRFSSRQIPGGSKKNSSGPYIRILLADNEGCGFASTLTTGEKRFLIFCVFSHNDREAYLSHCQKYRPYSPAS
jgi:hypothetical protein